MVSIFEVYNTQYKNDKIVTITSNIDTVFQNSTKLSTSVP